MAPSPDSSASPSRLADDPLEHLPAALAQIDQSGRCVLNHAARLVLGVEASSDVLELVDPTEVDALAELLRAARDGEPAIGTFRTRSVAGADAGPGEVAPAWAGVGGAEPLPRFVELRVRRAAREDVLMAAVTDVTEPVRMKQLLSTIVIATMIVDGQARPVWGPVGHAPESGEGELTGTLGDRTHPEDLATAVNTFVSALENPGSRQKITSRVRHPSKVDIWHEARVEIVNGRDDPRLGGLVITTMDSTDGDDVPSLGQTTGTHLSVADAAPVGIVLTGPGGLPMYFNTASRQLLPAVGVEAERDWTRFAHPVDRPRLGELITACADGRPGSMLARFDPGDDRTLWLMVTTCPRVAESGRLLGQVITLQDVTAEMEVKEALEAAQERLLHLARHDPLTGLVNRGVLAEELASRLAASTTAGSIAVLFCDLDGFKTVNDRYGHASGDEVLAEAATRLHISALAAHPDAVVARAGGDEFVVVLGGGAGAHPDDDVDALADVLVDDILRRLEEPFSSIEDPTLRIGISIGIAMSTVDDEPAAMVQRADAAMYEAKANGRGRATRAGS